MSTVVREYPFGQNQVHRHAGVRVRLAAALLDVIIMGIPVYLLRSLIFGFEIESERISYSPKDLLHAILLVVITVWLWVNWDGRTPGKKLVGIRIVSYPKYQPFSYRTALVRSLLGLVSGLTFGIGYVVMALMIASREDRWGFHDIIANTCVIHDA